MTERVAVYCRISEDPRLTEHGVTRQRQDCESLAAARGWEVVGVWTDNDVAVLRGDAHRPHYDAMLAAVQRGEVTRIVAYGLGRLWRNRRERAEAIDILKRQRVSVTLVKGSDLDMTSAAGRSYAGVLGEMDTMESELKAERVARAALQRAEQGRANGHVAYGWRRIRTRDASGAVTDWQDVVDPDQAAVVREIVDRLLSGASLAEIGEDLNARDVPPPRAALRAATGRDEPEAQRWLSSTLRKLALRPSNIGKLVRGGEEFGDAAWDPIVDPDRHAQVVALLSDPRRRSTRSGARRHLLSYGIGECGVCREVLRVQKRSGNQLYACDGPGGCVGRRREWVDQLVEATVIARLSEPDARDLLVRDDSGAVAARERADGIRARMADAADAFAAGEVDRVQLGRINARLRPELERAEHEAARVIAGVAPATVAELAGPAASERWSGMSVAQRRAVLTVLQTRVQIMPARGGPGFKPESVVITLGADEQGE